MNGTDRQRIRQAIDQHARQRRQRFLESVGRETCRGCGADLEEQTLGCTRCCDRKRRRERREYVAGDDFPFDT